MGIKGNLRKDDVKGGLDGLVDEMERKEIGRLERVGEMWLIEGGRKKG